jgi:hypothetical protein
MRKFLSLFKVALLEFNWSLHVQAFTVISGIVIAFAYLISPICFVGLFVLSYPIFYCAYQVHNESKTISQK